MIFANFIDTDTYYHVCRIHLVDMNITNNQGKLFEFLKVNNLILARINVESNSL